MSRLRDIPLGEPKTYSLGELKLHLYYLKVENRVRNDICFNHGLVELIAADRLRRNMIRTVSNQEARIDFYLPSQCIEIKFFTLDAARGRYYILLDLFKKNWWYARGLVVDSAPCAHNNIDRILTPDKRDWQILVSEYITVAAIVMLHAVYNDDRLKACPRT